MQMHPVNIFIIIMMHESLSQEKHFSWISGEILIFIYRTFLF